MKCSESCKMCPGVTCENTLTEICESSLEVDDDLGLDDRHFSDAFCWFKVVKVAHVVNLKLIFTD